MCQAQRIHHRGIDEGGDCPKLKSETQSDRGKSQGPGAQCLTHFQFNFGSWGYITPCMIFPITVGAAVIFHFSVQSNYAFNTFNFYSSHPLCFCSPL